MTMCMKRRSPARPIAAGLALLALALTPAASMAHDEPRIGAAAPGAGNAARGIVDDDLVAGSASSSCRGLLMGKRTGICTHGGDPAPAGRDVRAARSTADLRREAGIAFAPAAAGVTPGTSTPPTNGSGAIVCAGDGVSGKRVEVLYVRPVDRTDRFAAMKDAFGQYVVRADGQLNASAAETGGSRHWRFVTEPHPGGVAPCALRITKVDVGAADDDTFDATINALRARGYTRTDRKYLLFEESNVYCGIGTIHPDSQPGQGNLANGSYAEYARADAGCWNYAEAHELMHNIGGVQPGAPNATPGFHCTDENDEMCYDDDGAGPVFMRNVCSARPGNLFDCNHDDYFLAGVPAPGSWLATHWNTAMSGFVIDPLAVTVPEVRDEFRGEAGQDIRDAGLVPSFSGSGSPYAWVASQSPPGGTSASRGSTVNLRMQTGIIP